MKKCTHEWKPVPKGNGLYQDECNKCGAVGYVDWAEGKIKAKPMAKVISLCEFRKSREIKDLAKEL